MARAFMSETLSAWECPGVVETASLLTSELVTNAVLHAHSRVTVAVSLDDRRLRVEVCDDSPAMPVVRPYNVDDATGRGLPMVAAFAAARAAEPRPAGKCVWFEIDA